VEFFVENQFSEKTEISKKVDRRKNTLPNHYEKNCTLIIYHLSNADENIFFTLLDDALAFLVWRF
jgi:hypothetical protein